jgi:DNA topoisomerase-1
VELSPVAAAAVELARDPIAAASSAHLRYVTDEAPGIRRLRHGRDGRAFRYIGPHGRAVRDRGELRRIAALRVPPAWTEVWICCAPNGHIQATGRDARGRKQYRYHPRWRAVRDEAKYDRMMAFAAKLPAVRGRVRRDLARPGLPREKVLATVVRLLEETLIRVGNEEYARANRSYGLTTLKGRHVDVRGATLRFHFRGKGGKAHVVKAHDPRVARVVRQCQELPGHELFHYEGDGGALEAVESADVNGYLRAAAGEDFTAKDFRTWYGTLLAARALRDAPTERPTKTAVVQAVAQTAARLGNTPAVCRKCYVHPDVVAAYFRGALRPLAARESEERALARLLAEEAALRSARAASSKPARAARRDRS